MRGCVHWPLRRFDTGFLFLPTMGITRTIAEADAIRLNSNLGVFTSFVSFPGPCAIIVPVSFDSSGRSGRDYVDRSMIECNAIVKKKNTFLNRVFVSHAQNQLA